MSKNCWSRLNLMLPCLKVCSRPTKRAAVAGDYIPSGRICEAFEHQLDPGSRPDSSVTVFDRCQFSSRYRSTITGRSWSTSFFEVNACFSARPVLQTAGNNRHAVKLFCFVASEPGSGGITDKVKVDGIAVFERDALLGRMKPLHTFVMTLDAVLLHRLGQIHRNGFRRTPATRSWRVRWREFEAHRDVDADDFLFPSLLFSSFTDLGPATGSGIEDDHVGHLQFPRDNGSSRRPCATQDANIANTNL